MIDKWLYRFFGWIDSWFEWVEKEISTAKKKKKKKLKKVITEEQWIKKMLGKKNGK